MVTAIEIVIYEDFPIAFQGVASAFKKIEAVDLERGHSIDEGSHESTQRLRVSVEVHKNELLPYFHSDRNQSILLFGKILNFLELGRSLESTVGPVAPPMIGTPQDTRVTAWLCNDGGGVMPAHIEESAQDAILASNDNNWLSRNLCRDELTGICDLLRSPDHLPGTPENRLLLQFGDASIDVPLCGYG